MDSKWFYAYIQWYSIWILSSVAHLTIYNVAAYCRVGRGYIKYIPRMSRNHGRLKGSYNWHPCIPKKLNIPVPSPDFYVLAPRLSNSIYKKNDRESNLAVCKYQHLNISEASKLKPSIKVIQSHPKPYTLTIHRIHGLIGRGADAGTSWLHFEDQRLETTNPWGFGTCTVESEQGDTYQGIYIPVIYI